MQAKRRDQRYASKLSGFLKLNASKMNFVWLGDIVSGSLCPKYFGFLWAIKLMRYAAEYACESVRQLLFCYSVTNKQYSTFS